MAEIALLRGNNTEATRGLRLAGDIAAAHLEDLAVGGRKRDPAGVQRQSCRASDRQWTEDRHGRRSRGGGGRHSWKTVGCAVMGRMG